MKTVDGVPSLEELLRQYSDWSLERLMRELDRLQHPSDETKALRAKEMVCQLRAALLMVKHAYETDNRPNMSIVEDALRTTVDAETEPLPAHRATPDPRITRALARQIVEGAADTSEAEG